MRALRSAAVASVLAVGMPAVGHAQADPALAKLTEKAEACLKAHAPDVERAEPSLSNAVSFLAQLCAVEIQRRENYIGSARILQMMQRNQSVDLDDLPEPADAKVAARAKANMARTKAEWAKITINPETGDLNLPHDSQSAATYGFSLMGFQNASGKMPADLSAQAARNLLDARKARQSR